MKIKQKLFGFKGPITPSVMIKGLSEKWDQEGITFIVKEGIFKVNYSSKGEEENALAIAELFVHGWNFSHDTKIKVKFNNFWEPKQDSKMFHSLTLEEKLKVSDRSTTAHKLVHRLSYEVKSRIIGKSDSASFITNRLIVEKSLKDESLKKALEFYSKEVINDKKPLYGVYKAIEELCASAGGRKNLADMVNKSKKYVDDLMQTTQIERHSRTSAKRLLSNTECLNRSKKLITAYADSISI